jgi:hypothetical protein
MNKIKLSIIIFCLISISMASLIRPINGENLSYIYILFEWEQEPDAIGYNIQVSESVTFNTTLLNTNTETPLYIDKENVDWENTYHWRVRPIYNLDDDELGSWIATSSFSIGEKQFPERDVDIYNEDLIQDGLVAFGGFAPSLASVVIDKYGNEIWNTGEEGSFDLIINHINKFGNIYGLSNYNYPNNTGTKTNYDRSFLWSAPTSDPQYAVDIHEIKQIPNGNYMAFVPDYQLGPIPEGSWTFYYQAIGYQADGITNEYPWIGMRIVEWDEDWNEVWSWDPFEHFSMDDTDLYGGTWWNVQAGSHDWMHSNAFHFDEQESVIYVSHRHLSRISKIAYPSGEVIWNIGMPEEYNTGSDNICTDLGNSFQHNIQLLDDGSLLFFDNGNLSPMLMGDDNPTTRIRRIRVIDNSYCQTEWEYELPENLFGLGMGSVQLLDNGNYLLYTYGSGLNQTQPTLREVTSSHEVVWNYQGAGSAAWYRTYKIPSLHPDAFSVIADGYTLSEDNNSIIQVSDNSLDFTIYNESGYTQPYTYIFYDSMDGGIPMFDYDEGELTIAPYDSINLSFLLSNGDVTSTSISLDVWPTHHKYSAKSFEFPVSIDSTILGDVNYDGGVDVIDVVLVVNMILGNYDLDLNASDLNNDGELNVVDIVILVNLILSI